MTKLRFERLPVQDWLELDALAPAPTFFASPAWALAVARVFPALEPWPLTSHLEDGSRVFVPLARQRSGRLRWKLFVGVPLYGYTAVMTERGLAAPVLAARVVNEILLAGDEVLINLWPFQTARAIKADIRIAAETSAMDISGGVEAARAKIGSKSRRMAGQAIRKGAVCGVESGEAAIAIYYALLREAARERWHRAEPTIREDFLRAVCSQGCDAVEIWIVRYEGEPVAGGVALYGSREVSLWTTATKPGMEILRPHNLLHATIIAHAAGRGLDWYNLNSSSHLEGVLKFKKALGAANLAYEIVGHRSLRLRLASVLKRLGRPAAPTQ